MSAKGKNTYSEYTVATVCSSYPMKGVPQNLFFLTFWRNPVNITSLVFLKECKRILNLKKKF